MPILFFFFNDTATTEIYTLSLHDALPICPSPASLRNHFHAAWAQSRRARLRRTMRREGLPPTTWIVERANVQSGGETRDRPFQLTVCRDSIRRGSRTGNSEVLGTSRR